MKILKFHPESDCVFVGEDTEDGLSHPITIDAGINIIMQLDKCNAFEAMTKIRDLFKN